MLRQISEHGSVIKKVFTFLMVVAVVINFPVQFVKSVSVVDGNEKIDLYTFTDDAERILSNNDIKVDGNDDYEVTNNSGDITIKINRTAFVNLTVGGKTEKHETDAETVGEFLKECGYTVDEYDELNCSKDAKIVNNMNIVYNDVEYVTESVTETVKYSTKKVKTTSLPSGEKKTVTEGKNGEREIITFKKYVNGKETEVTVNKAITKKPTKKVVKVGVAKEEKAAAVNTVKSGRTVSGGKKANSSSWMSDLTPKSEIKLDKNGVPVNYKKLLTGNASAYCTGTTCSTGVKVKQGYIAVDPSIIPYGTKMYIRTPDGSWIYGYAVAADTGGFVSWGNTIADLYMYSYDDCIKFGRRQIEIYIL